MPVPDLRVIERPGWLQLVTPSFRRGSPTPPTPDSPVATTQARAETSAPLLARMGFSEITRFTSYEAVDEP